MQFKHPEILYALFLLLIPIIVHLFQLRRFKKVPFTNVKFLKKVEQNTRKSAKLKKFLILCTRLLTLLGLILAFAQPFTSAVNKDRKQNMFLYLDNSLSMQAKGSRGELLKRAAQDIIENYTSEKNLHIITNNKFLKNQSVQDLKKQLLTIDYYPIRQDLNTILFKIKNAFETNTNTLNEAVLISDFQNVENIEIDSLHSYHFVQTTPVKNSNLNLDSVFIADQNGENITLRTLVKSYSNTDQSATVSLYNGTILQGKSNVALAKNGLQSVEFVIPAADGFDGKLVLEDSNLTFDNELYFSINKEDKINVTAIGNNATYLNKIYTEDEFNFTVYQQNQIDYSNLSGQNLIIINELQTIPVALINTLNEFLNNGGKLVLIPPLELSEGFRNLLQNLGIGKVERLADAETAITDIHFSHPILKNVFEKQVKNFQYPTVKSHLNYLLRNSNPILTLENSKPFITEVKTQNSSIYLFSAAIDKENSNFKNSPLIVPVFYNFGKQSYKHSEISYTIGNHNEIEIKAQLEKDDILQISNEEGSFIPLQKIGNHSVILTLDEQPLLSGFYQLKNKENVLKNLSFNYNRNESHLSYANIEEILKKKDNISIHSSIKEALQIIDNEYKTNNLWQWFLIATIVFLLAEILILKFLKT